MASTAAKVGIGCLIAVVLGVLLLAGGSYFFYQYYGKDMIEAAKHSVDEGEAFGRDSDEWRCVNEALDRYRRERGMGSAIKTRIFLKSCLETSTGAAGFCDGVPGTTEFTRTISWRQEKCEQANLGGDQYCQQFFEEMQQYCNGRGRGKSRPEAAPRPRTTPTRRPRRRAPRARPRAGRRTESRRRRSAGLTPSRHPPRAHARAFSRNRRKVARGRGIFL